MTNKNFFKSILAVCLIAFTSVAAFISCEVGLGEAVDVAAPTITIESPKTSSVIRDSFAIKGAWADDGTIKDITVSLRNTRTAQTFSDITGEVVQEEGVKESKGSWSAIINPVKDKIPDGNYEATVTIRDNGSHTTVISRAFIIDNTPPVVVLQRPSTKATDSDSDVFGQTLTLSGQSADDNNVKELHINFYSDPECTNKLLENPIIKKNVPPTISLDIAKFLENENNDYAKIYGSVKKDGKKPPVYCSIIAYDEAIRLPLTPEDAKADDNMGNSSDIYYLYDDIYADVLSEFKVTQLYSIMNGTYEDEDSSRAADAKSIPDLLEPNEVKAGKLTLNPANNPEFKVVGREGLEKDGKDFNNPANDLSNESNITLKVDVGLDAIPLNKDTLKVYLLPCDIYGTPGAEDIPANRIYPNPSDPPYEKNGTGYTFTTKITKEGCKNAEGQAVSLTVGNYYIIAMEGFDSMSNEVVAESDEDGHIKTFGFRLAPNGATPQLDVQTSINGKAFDDSAMLYVPRYNPDDETKITTLKFKGTVSVEDGVPTAEYSLDGKARLPLTVTPAGQEGVFVFETEIDVDDFEFTDEGEHPELKSGKHGIEFYASVTQDAIPVKKTLMYQVDKPTVKITNVEPLAYNYYYGTNGALVESGGPEKITVNGKEVSKKYINGKNVKLNVTILPGLVGLDESEGRKPKIDFIQNGNIVYTINDAPTFGETDEIDTTDTSIFSPGQVIVRITAYDMAGYKTVIEETYYIDQATDDPVILPKDPVKSTLSMDEATARNLENKIKNVYYANQTVLYRVIDDDGIDKVTYTIANASNPSLALKTETISLSGATDSQVEVSMLETPATYHVTLVVTDANAVTSTGLASKTRTVDFYARVTASAPNIEEIQLSKSLFTNHDTVQPVVSIKSDQAPFILARIVKQGQTVNSSFSKLFTHNGRDIEYDGDTLEWLGYTKQELGLQDSDTVISTGTIAALNSESPAVTDSIDLSSVSASGSYTVEYRVIDVNYKSKEATKSFTVDVNAPQIDEVKLDNAVFAAAKWYKSKTLALNVKASDAEDAAGMSTVEYSTDGSTWTALSYDSASAEYKGSAVFQSEGTANKLYVRVTDRAGNTVSLANPGYYTVKIDASVPELGVTDKLGVTDNTNKYVQAGKSLTVQGTYEDPQSGVDTLTFKIGNTEITDNVTATYSTDNSTFKDYAQISDKTTIKYWKATFTPGDSGKFAITGKNIAGDSTAELKAFDITIDETAPVMSNVKLEETKGSETKDAYYGKDKDGYYYYYINNSTAAGKSFKISGVSTDDTGIESVTINITTNPPITTQPTMEGSTGKWSFNLDCIKGKTTDATAVVTVKDNSGRETPETLYIVFDTTKPKAMHWADAKNKDIYFRIGNADNDKDSSKWETGDTVGNGTTDADKANMGVGGKYSFGTYGKDSSMEFRGTFEEEGSGLKAVYYKLYDSADAINISGFEAGTDSADGNISIVNETKHVPYNKTDGTKGSVTVTSNFRGQIQVFNNTETAKYLVLVAEDNAGNRAADTLAIYGGPTGVNSNDKWNSQDHNSTNLAYYSLNKDTTPPTIDGRITDGAYTDGTGNLVVGGNVSDDVSGSGLKKVTVRIDDKEESEATINNDGTWTKTIAVSSFVPANTSSGTYTVYATATDNAGEGNSKQISVGTITVDTEAPKFENIRFTETESSVTKDVYTTTDSTNGTIYYVKNNSTTKTFKIFGLATDNFGVESVKLDVIDTTENSTTTPLSETKTDDDVKGTCEFTIGNWKSWTTNNAKATITVTDKAGKTITKELTIKFDRTAPTVTPAKFTLPTKEQTESNLFKFEGTSGSISDATSAPDKVDIAFNNSTTAPTTAQVSGIDVSSDGTWSSTVEFTKAPFNTVFNTEGEKYLWVKAYDKTGNSSAWTKSTSFKYDKSVPTISFDAVTPAANSYNKSGFTIKVAASDSWGVNNVKIYKVVDTTETELGDATGSSGTYSKAFKVGSETTANAIQLEDGNYNFKVVVTDKAGKTNTVTRSFSVDTTAPTFGTKTITTSEKATVNGTVWYKTNQISVSIPVSDALSKVSSVQIATDSNFTNTSSLLLKNEKYEGSITCDKQGLNTIYVKAIDNAQNEATSNFSVYIDTVPPEAPIFLGAGITPASEITSLLVNPSLEQPVTVYAAVIDGDTAGNQTGIADSDALVQKGKSGSSTKIEGTTLPSQITIPSTVTTNHIIYSYTIPPEDMLSGGVNFTATDKAGNSAEYTLFQMTVDQNPPQLTVDDISDADSSTTDVTEINNKISISGIASDENGLSTSEKMKLYYTKSTTLTAAPAASNIGDKTAATDADTKWIEIGSIAHAASWKFSDIDTSKLDGTNAISDDTTVSFIIVAKDKAGNEKPSNIIAAKVNQNTDRPVITLNQLAKNNQTTLRIKNVYGSIQDDDGNVAKMWYRTTAPTTAPDKDQATANGWTEIQVNGGSWAVDSTEEDGETVWYFAVQDKEGNIFWNAAANTTNGPAELSQPYFKCADTGTTKNSLNGIAFKYDTTPPSATKLELARYETGTTKTVEEIYTADTNNEDDDNIVWSTTNNLAFGGDYNVLYAKIEVTEGTGMKALSGTNGSAPTSSPVLISYKNTNGTTYTYKKEEIKEVHTEDSTTYTYYLGPITMDTNEAHEFKVTVEDAVGNKGFISRNIIVDNTAPASVSNLKPNALGEQNGTFTYRGDANDNKNGSGVVKVEWCIPNTDQTTTSASGLVWRDAPLSSQWEIDFSGDYNMSDLIGYSTSSPNADVGEKFRGYETDTTNHSGVYNIPVWFRLTDAVGNEGYDITNGRIKYNPNTDRPSVLIGSPVHNKTVTINGNEINYVIMGGKTARISGSADDDEGIAKVFLQFDMDGDGKWDTGVPGLTADLTATTLASATTMITGTPWPKTDITEIAITKNGVKTSFGYGIEVGTTKNWAYTLNLSSDQLPKITETNTGTENNPVYTYSGETIKVRAIAIDNDTENGQLQSAWSETLNVSVSNDIPIFNNLKLKQFSGTQAISEIEYTPGMYLTGTNWYLTGDVQATGGISDASYGTNTDAKSCFTGKSGSTDQFDMKIPVDFGSQTSWNVTIRVVDDSDDKKPNTQKIELNVDNTPPAFAETYASANVGSNGTVKHYMNAYGSNKGASLTPTTKLYDTDGYASLWGKVTDNGSGFDKAVFYLKRTDANGSSPRVHNLMEDNVRTALSTSSAVGAVYIDTTSDTDTTGDNLPALYVKNDTTTAKMTVTRPSEYSIKVELGTGAPATVTGVKDNTNIRVGGLVKIGGLYRTITAVGTDGTVSFTPSCDRTFTEAWFIYGMVVDSSGETKTGNNLNETDNDGMLENFQTISGTTTWNAALPTSNIPDGPIELHVVVFDAAGNMAHGYTKTGIENRPLRITKVMLGTNFNGNTTYDYPSEFETFYALTTSSGNKVINQGKDIWNLDTKKELGSSNYFTAKNGLAVVPEFVGGTGDIYYAFEKTSENKDEPKELTAATTNKLTNDKVTGTIDIEGEGNKIGQLVLANNTIGTSSGENEMNYFNFSFWDSTEGATPGKNSSWTILNAQIYQDLVDDTAPNIVIEPFRWAGDGSTEANANNTTEVVRKFTYSTVKGNKGYSSKYFFYTDAACTVDVDENTADNADVYTKETVSINSLYDNLSANGHIDLSANLPESKFTTTTGDTETVGEYDRDPKVSGQITFSGTAYDNVGLSSLWFSFDGFTPTNYYSATDKYGNSGKKTGVTVATGVTKDFYQAAYYDPSSGWKLASAAIDDGWKFTVSEAKGEGYFNQNGHKVRWTLSIDTAKISDTAGTDKTLYMLAVDHNAETTATTKVSAFTAATTDSQKTADEGTNNVPSYKVDVVPYITGLKRATALTDTHRSLKGKYQVVVGETVNITGFNLPGTTDNAIKLQVSGQQNNATGTVKTQFKATGATGTTGMAFKVPATSGYIKVETSGVSSLNNINTGNEMEGNYDTDTWTDDVYLSVWKNDEYFYFSNDPISPAMDRIVATKKDANYNANVYTLYGGWATNGSMFFASYPNTTGSGTSGNAPNPANSSGTTIGTKKFGDPATFYDVIIDSSGNRYNMLLDCWQGNDRGWGQNFVVNRNGYYTHVNSGSGNAVANVTASTANYKHVIERMGNYQLPDQADSSDGYDEMFNQFLNPRLALYDGVTYLSYYDRYAKCLKYAALKPIDSADYIEFKYSTEGMRNGGGANSAGTFRKDGYTSGECVVAGYDTTQSGGSKTNLDVGRWSSIAVDTTATAPVIAYYDSTNKRLMLATANGNGNGTMTNHTTTALKTSYPLNSNTPVLTGTATSKTEGDAWTRQEVKNTAADSLLRLGQYVSMVTDAGGNLHIACNGAKGGNKLYYIYGAKQSYGTYNFTITVVDAEGAGTWTDIQLEAPTQTGANAKPVISYYDPSNDSSENAVKVAYLENDGVWDTMTAPLSSSAVSDRITLALDITDGASVATATANNSKLAVGYVSSRFDCVYLRKE